MVENARSRRTYTPRLRRRFCFECNKPTFLEHNHAVRPFEHLLRENTMRRRG